MVSEGRQWIVVFGLLVSLPTWAVGQDQQPATVSGRVVSIGGGPLGLADVRIPALGVGARTEENGNYAIVVPGAKVSGQRVTIVARMLGYKALTVEITLQPGSITQDFTLQADPLRLDEVIVMGAGTEQIVERLGTARAGVDAVTLKRTNETNVIQALAGVIPNVITNQASGDAGASTSIQIRGAKTFGTSQPVIVVDGVVMSNATRGQAVLSGAPSPNRASDLNVEDIESVEILKGAAASSIFGSSAGSAGAILITTKRGKSGRTQYTLRSTLQVDEAIRTLPVQRRWGVGANGVSSQCTTVNCSIASNFFAWGPELAPGTPTFDHGSEIFETGQLIENTVTASGGSDRTTFYLSAGQVNQDGFIVQNRDTYERYTTRFSGTHWLIDNLQLSANISVVQTKGSGVDRGNSINGIGIGALRQPPEFDAQNYLGNGLHRSWRFPNPGPLAFTNNRGFDNPFYALNANQLDGQTGRFFGNLSADWRPLPAISVSWKLGGDYNSDDRTYAYARSSSGTTGGAMERWQFYDRIYDHNLTVKGTHEFSPALRGTVTVGQNLNETYFRQVDVFAQTWIAPTPFKLSNTVSRTLPNDAESRRRVEGYFGQADVDLYDQVFLQLRARNDANSAFGINYQRAWYPGGSVAWSFTKALRVPESVLSFGKVRLAYGESGQQPPLYATQNIFSAAAFADFNPGSLQGTTLNGLGGLYASATLGNPDIKPERVGELEGGVDLSLFSGRADLSVTRYLSKSEDIIFGVGLPPSTGFTAVNLNAGVIENKGWELSGNLRVIQRGPLTVELGANWGLNRNMVTSLGAIDAQLQGTVPMPTAENCGSEARYPRCQIGFASSFAGQSTHAQVGYPLGVWRSADFARCGRGLTTVTFAGSSHDVGTACAGAPDGALFIAANGYPITDPTTRAIGNPWPDWTAGFSLNVAFKGVRFSAFIDHRHGGDVLNMTRASMYQYGTHLDTEIRGQSRTFGDDMLCHNKTCNVLNGPVVGPGAGTPVVIGEGWFSGGVLGSGQGATGGPISTRLEDGTFTRLREVSVGYSFQGAWVRKIVGMRQLDVKITGRNLKLWTVYSGYDPEVNLGGAQNGNRGIDWFNAPLAQAWVFQVTFQH